MFGEILAVFLWFFDWCVCVLAVSSCVLAWQNVETKSGSWLGEVFSSDSDFEIVKPQSFSFSRKRQPNMGSGLSSGCKKNAELLGQQ